jgi:hypothetical protein
MSNTKLSPKKVNGKFCLIQFGETTVRRKLKVVGAFVEWKWGWDYLKKVTTNEAGKLTLKHW